MSIQKIRNNTVGAFKGNKGFTLVEVIVVLVILAILAAILVPKLTGWIDQAKAKTATGEGHLVLSALQADVSEQYGLNTATTFKYVFDADRVGKYLTGDADATKIDADSVKVTADGKVKAFTYTASNNKVVTYNTDVSKGFTVGDPAAE